jgi:hypothetical protein
MARLVPCLSWRIEGTSSEFGRELHVQTEVLGLYRADRYILPLTRGFFRGPKLKGKLLKGAIADWQIVTEDGTAFGDIRCTLQTDGGRTKETRPYCWRRVRSIWFLTRLPHVAISHQRPLRL